MSGKRGLVMGVANDHSIAWGIAKALAAEGAELAFTYQNDALGKRVAPITGHRTERMTAEYSRDASQEKLARASVLKWSKVGKRNKAGK